MKTINLLLAIILLISVISCTDEPSIYDSDVELTPDIHQQKMEFDDVPIFGVEDNRLVKLQESSEKQTNQKACAYSWCTNCVCDNCSPYPPSIAYISLSFPRRAYTPDPLSDYTYSWLVIPNGFRVRIKWDNGTNQTYSKTTRLTYINNNDPNLCNGGQTSGFDWAYKTGRISSYYNPVVGQWRTVNEYGPNNFIVRETSNLGGYCSQVNLSGAGTFPLATGKDCSPINDQE